ncbi:MAG TPA: hypothetical protein VGH24_01965 [Solirubrobacteraceae bacterium]
MGGRFIKGLVIAAVAAGLGVGTALLTGSATAGSAPSVTPDTSFNGGNPVLLTFPTPAGASGSGVMFATAVARQSDGKVVVGGAYNFSGVSDFDVARLNTNGTLDTSFGSGGYATVSPIGGGNNALEGLAIQSDGKIVLAGRASSSGQTQRIALARLTTSGALDSGFGSGGVLLDTSDSEAVAVALDANDKILTTGSGGDVHRYTAAGAIDTTFNGTGKSGSLMQYGTAIALQSDGKIVIAGSTFISPNSHALIGRFNSDGSTDAGFGTGAGSTDLTSSGSESLSAMTLQNSDIVVGGRESSGSTSENLLAQLDSTGHLVTSFGSGGKAIDSGGGGISSLLYVPYPSDQVATQGTVTNTAGVAAVDPTTGKVISGSSLPGGGGLNASAETCSQPAQECTTDSVGQDPNANHAEVTQDKASDGTSTTPTTTSTTPTSETCPGTTRPPPCIADLSLKLSIFTFEHDYPVSTDSRGVVAVPDSYRHGIDVHGDYDVGHVPEPIISVTNDGPLPSPGGTLTLNFTGFGGNLPQPKSPDYLCAPPLAQNQTTCHVVAEPPRDEEHLAFSMFYAPTARDGSVGIGQHSIFASLIGGINDPTSPDKATLTFVIYPQQVAKQTPISASEPATELDAFKGFAGVLLGQAGDNPAAVSASIRSLGVAKRVQIALVRLRDHGRGSAGTRSACSWLTGPKATFKDRSATKGACDGQVWLNATGTSRWRYTLKRHLLKGSYVLYSRVIDAAGLPGVGFSRERGDRQAFRLT